MVVGAIILQVSGGLRASVPALVAQSGPFAKGILALLLVMSVYSWAVIWNRMRLYARVEKADKKFLGSFRRVRQNADFRLVSEQHPDSLLARVVGFLATTGSVSPFIGLMGTVWGVMTAFLNIGAQGSASLIVVAPGIAEALIATVAGLAAAIPAVVGYNHLLGRLRDLTNATGQFTNEFLDQRLGGPGA